MSLGEESDWHHSRQKLRSSPKLPNSVSDATSEKYRTSHVSQILPIMSIHVAIAGPFAERNCYIVSNEDIYRFAHIERLSLICYMHYEDRILSRIEEVNM